MLNSENIYQIAIHTRFEDDKIVSYMNGVDFKTVIKHDYQKFPIKLKIICEVENYHRNKLEQEPKIRSIETRINLTE